MPGIIKKIFDSIIDMRNADNSFAPLKIIFSAYVVWLLTYSVLLRHVRELTQLYHMTDDVLLIQHDAMLLFLSPALVGAIIVMIGACVMHLLVYLNVASYSWFVNATVLTVAFIAFVAFLLVGLWAKALTNKAIQSGLYTVCPYGENSFSRKTDYGGSRVYRLALLAKDSNYYCR